MAERHSAVKTGDPNACDDVDGPRRRHARRDESVRQGQIPRGLADTWDLENDSRERDQSRGHWRRGGGRGRGAGSTDGSVLGTQCTARGPQPACRVTWEGLLRGQTLSAHPRENVAPPPPHLPGETARPAPAALTTSQRTDTPRTMNLHGDACPLRLSDGGRGPCSCPLQDTTGVPAVTVLGWQPRPPNKWVWARGQCPAAGDTAHTPAFRSHCPPATWTQIPAARDHVGFLHSLHFITVQTVTGVALYPGSLPLPDINAHGRFNEQSVHSVWRANVVPKRDR